MLIPADDPRATAAKAAIEGGDLAALTALLGEHPELATARVAHADPKCGDTRTLLHVATDWPGHFPDVARHRGGSVAAGADVNAHMESTQPRHRETPLHWAASCNDVAVLDALLDAGADIEACHGGRRPTAELLLARGADPYWIGWDDLSAAGAAQRNGFDEVAA
jgi:hypothetical protein